MMGGGSIEGNKNTFVSCCSSKQMCSRSEYAKHTRDIYSFSIIPSFCQLVRLDFSSVKKRI